MTAKRWLLLADDLTGAADSAVAFAARGLPTVVGWAGRLPEPGPGPGLFAYDGESRSLSAADALAKRRRLAGALLPRGANLFVKIDSTLRGQPAAEIRATLEAAARLEGPVLGVLAPAFPATGRTTLDGRVRVRGEPLEQTELWRRDHSYPSTDLAQMLAAEGLTGTKLPLAAIRAGDAALERALAAVDGLAVCDAATDDDLDRIARAGLRLGRPVVWIGAGGLTAALARAMPPPQSAPFPFPTSGRGVLVVVGSPAQASRVAAEHLAGLEGLIHVPIASSTLLAPGKPENFPSHLIQALDQGTDILINLLPEDPVDFSHAPALAAALASRLQPLADHIGALAVTGGETAAALLTACGIDGVRLADEIEPGVSVGLSLGKRSLPLVTKAGAFGDEGVLTRAVLRLRRLNREGYLA